jgi:hypothetical protein
MRRRLHASRSLVLQLLYLNSIIAIAIDLFICRAMIVRRRVRIWFLFIFGSKQVLGFPFFLWKNLFNLGKLTIFSWFLPHVMVFHRLKFVVFNKRALFLQLGNLKLEISLVCLRAWTFNHREIFRWLIQILNIMIWDAWKISNVILRTVLSKPTKIFDRFASL